MHLGKQSWSEWFLHGSSLNTVGNLEQAHWARQGNLGVNGLAHSAIAPTLPLLQEKSIVDNCQPLGEEHHHGQSKANGSLSLILGLTLPQNMLNLLSAL